jgi:hypothetical protein
MLLRVAALAAAAGTLGGCFMMKPPPQTAAAQPEASQPQPAPPPEAPPVPLRKPPPPPSRTASPPPGQEVARLEPPAETPPGNPLPPVPLPPVPELVGLDQAALTTALGQPDSRRDSPPAIIWRYVDGDCAVDVYLYRDVETNALHALYVDVNGDDRTEQRRQLCLQRLARRTGTVQHAGSPDAAAAR